MSGKIRDIEINDISGEDYTLESKITPCMRGNYLKTFYERAKPGEIKSCTFLRVRQ